MPKETYTTEEALANDIQLFQVDVDVHLTDSKDVQEEASSLHSGYCRFNSRKFQLKLSEWSNGSFKRIDTFENFPTMISTTFKSPSAIAPSMFKIIKDKILVFKF